MDWILSHAEQLGGLGSLVSAVVTVLAVVFAARQIAVGRASTRESTAFMVYQAYIRSCVERPHLSSWHMFQVWSGMESAKGIDQVRSVEAEMYLWFINEMLSACELIFYSVGSDKSWINTIESNVQNHRIALREVWPHWRNYYSKGLLTEPSPNRAKRLRNSHNCLGSISCRRCRR